MFFVSFVAVNCGFRKLLSKRNFTIFSFPRTTFMRHFWLCTLITVKENCLIKKKTEAHNFFFPLGNLFPMWHAHCDLYMTCLIKESGCSSIVTSFWRPVIQHWGLLTCFLYHFVLHIIYETVETWARSNKFYRFEIKVVKRKTNYLSKRFSVVNENAHINYLITIYNTNYACLSKIFSVNTHN